MTMGRVLDVQEKKENRVVQTNDLFLATVSNMSKQESETEKLLTYSQTQTQILVLQSTVTQHASACDS